MELYSNPTESGGKAWRTGYGQYEHKNDEIKI